MTETRGGGGGWMQEGRRDERKGERPKGMEEGRERKR